MSYDLMRVFACLAVIMVHVAGTGLCPGRDYPILTIEWCICMFFASSVRWSVPLFFMISGALFLDEKKQITTRRLYCNNILRLACVLVVWTLFYHWFAHGSILPFGLTAGHLWFLPMIIALYMAIPILRMLSNQMRDYYLLIWAIWIIIDSACTYTDCFPFDQCEHFFFSGYIGYFVLGDWCRRNVHNKRIIIPAIILGLLGVAVTFIGSFICTRANDETQFFLHSYLAPTTMFTAVAAFYTCNILASRMSQNLRNIVSYVSALTLGIYLIHMEILIQIYTRVQRFVPQPIFYIPIICIMAFIIGAFFTWLIKKIPYVNRYIV